MKFSNKLVFMVPKKFSASVGGGPTYNLCMCGGSKELPEDDCYQLITRLYKQIHQCLNLNAWSILFYLNT